MRDITGVYGMNGAEQTAADVSGRLLDVLTEHLRGVPADVDWDTVALADLGLDSMSAIELVITIEDTFGVQFRDELLVRETFATFAALESAIREMARPQ
ncbi:Aminoacyl carrier protein [Streptomyces xanthophaeus]|uniref:acyl carrier protein n=1 Tax=Streptomyces xanthophaeus TaxID=67385 RepID=UPI00233E93CA|nr:phosphopantetheine-binding protein [Streptomyces xanthophaeus]WCD88439.1 Aminoacyl carrier protein [Streptomyces xanthophaeus]